ncbi:hypothetical protein [Desemzia sp. RIT 804]|nr:hypothetical protein [Desemzia sp. RIT 804]
MRIEADIEWHEFNIGSPTGNGENSHNKVHFDCFNYKIAKKQ